MKVRSLSPALACAALLACAAFAHASSITYNYTSAGPWINNVGGGGDPIPCLNQAGCQPSGYLTFSSAIPGNEEYYNNGTQPSSYVMDSLFDSSTITLTDYSFTDGVTTFTPTNSTIALSSIQTIFNDGTIDYWDININLNTSIGGVTPVLYLNNEQPNYTEVYEISTIPGVASDSIVGYPFGSWTASSTVTTPEPTTWALFGTGALALLAFAAYSDRRRRVAGELS
jgi:PEP-CTERM motif